LRDAGGVGNRARAERLDERLRSHLRGIKQEVMPVKTGIQHIVPDALFRGNNTVEASSGELFP